MAKSRQLALLVVLLVVLPFSASTVSGQSSDLGVAVTDTPDPVAPDGNITYVVTVSNSGPDSATNARLNVPLNGTLLFQSITAPKAWSCVRPPVNGGTSISCTSQVFLPGTSVFEVVLKAGRDQFGINDRTITQNFDLDSDITELNYGNNSVNVTTAYVTADSDLSVTATDSPDPVAPDGNITYTITVRNSGPDTATTARLNVPLNGTLSFQSITSPSGWNCVTPPVNGGSSFSCTATTLASATTSVFVLVLKAGLAQLGRNDLTISQNFNVTSDLSDPNNGNNSVNATTLYVTPDADMAVTATDSPDPVAPDGNITYTVSVTSAGPDTATNARLNVPLNGTLLFQSITAPAGWSCVPPPVNGGVSFSCTATTIPAGTSLFSIVLKAGKAQLGINDLTINQNFNVTSDLSDPNSGNNSVNATTAYVTPDADIRIVATDAPDPVAPDGDITYTVTVTNAGPDVAPNVSLSVPLNNTLLFQSITRPAGWTCNNPAVNGGTSFFCAATGVAIGSSSFSIVLKAASSRFGTNIQTISQSFNAASDISDPVSSNNSVSVATSYRSVGFDPDGTGSVEISDAFYLIRALFENGPAPVGSGDANGDGTLTVADVYYVLAFLFQNGPAPR